MDVMMPDGVLVRDVPDGITQTELMRRYQARPSEQAAPEDPGALMAGVIGAGRTLDRLLAGGKQAYYGLTDNEAELAKLKQEQDDNTRIYAGLQEKRPIATTLGEIAPLVATLPAAGTLTGAAAISALPGALEYGSVGERAGRAALGAAGGAAGAGAGKLLGRAIQPFRPTPTVAQQSAQDAAQRIGVQLRPGEVVQSRPMRWLESSLNDLPLSGGMAQAQETARRQAINRAASNAIGQNAPEVTENVLANARTSISNTFDSLLAGRSIELDNAFRNEVRAITGSKVMKSLRNEEVEAIIAPFQNMPAGTIKVTGEWFQQNKTALDAVIRSAYNAGENGKARALEGFEKALERAAVRSMSPDEAAAFKAAQKQWASLRLLETGKVVEGGNVMPGRLDSALTSRYKAAYKEGKIKGELADIGKLAQTYKPLPQSGTTPRAIYSGMAGGAMFANPLATAAMFAGPPLAQKFLQSGLGQRYLTEGMANITPATERLLMRGGYGLLGLPLSAAVD